MSIAIDRCAAEPSAMPQDTPYQAIIRGILYRLQQIPNFPPQSSDFQDSTYSVTLSNQEWAVLMSTLQQQLQVPGGPTPGNR